MPVKKQINSQSPEETHQLGILFGQSLKPGSVLALFGELGSGKTTFLKGVIHGINETPPHEITSPTFTYLHVYEGKIPVYHFDLYRLKNAAQFHEIGFDEFFNQGGICCIEWAERIEEALPENTLRVYLESIDENSRKLEISDEKMLLS